MVRPTARVLALLELLQAGGTRSVADLARRLAVDERTVRRYAEHLRDLDVPVDTVRGRHGGYRLARHYRMPPLMLTDEEALAVVWGLLLGTRSESGPASRYAVQSALAKVRRVLPAVLARRMDAVVDVVGFTTSRADDDSDGDVDESSARVILLLAEAARDRRPVTFGYTARQGSVTQRSVQPHGVVAHDGRLYLTGFDSTRQARRTFRLDRIDGVHLLDGTFVVPADVDPVQQVLGPLAPTPRLHEVSFRIRADVVHVRTRIPETLASVTAVTADPEADEGWLRVLLRAERLEWVAGTLAMLDRPFVIERPGALRVAVAALGQQLLAADHAPTS